MMARFRNRLPLVPLEPAQAFFGEKTLSIRRLKDFVVARFPDDHPLRVVILAERDFLTAAEFLAKMEVWSVLLNQRA